MLDGLSPGPKWWFAPGSKILPLTLIGGMICMGLVLTGCNNNNSTLSSQFSLNNGKNDLPPEVTAQKELLDTAPLEALGRPNPFASLLEPPKSAQSDSGDATPAPLITYQDPFEGFNVGGIVYRAKKPLAILSLPDTGSKIVHVGDVLPTATDSSIQAKVTQIGKESVTLKVISPPEDFPEEFKVRSITLSKIIGFRGAASATRGSKGKKGAETGEGASATETGAAPDAAFQNLMNQLSGKK